VGRNERLDAFVQTALAAHPSSRFDSGQQMLEAWWRVSADIERDTLFQEGVEVVFEFEDDIEVSTDVTGNKHGLLETLAEPESTTVNRHGPLVRAEPSDTQVRHGGPDLEDAQAMEDPREDDTGTSGR
jgi:hypothetical protein